MFSIFSSGAKAAAKLDAVEFVHDPDAVVCGQLSVMSEALLGNKQWHKMHCYIKDSTLCCFRKPDDAMPEVALSLPGLVMLPASSNKHKMALALADGDVTKIHIEVRNWDDEKCQIIPMKNGSLYIFYYFRYLASRHH